MKNSNKLIKSLRLHLLFISIVVLTSFKINLSKDQEKIFLIINKSSKLIEVSERNNTIFIWIKFELPNYRANLSHTPSKANHWEYSHEEIEVGQMELNNSEVLFADKLSFKDWSDMEQIARKKKVYAIFHEEYMSKDRFIYNKKFKAFEVWVTADGPI